MRPAEMNRSLSFLLLALFSIFGAAEAKESTDPELIIVFLFFGALLGATTTQILTRFAPGVPYTVVVFLEGIVIAAINDNSDLGDFGKSVDAWTRIDAELILFIFLPILIFGEAMSLKWHHVKGVFVQALLLAGPGVGIGAVLTACFVKALPLGWSWNFAMVFGSILSATDPVAVVALLKNAGASPKLTILIIGESLMNDGTAMVLFGLFFNMMKGEHYSGGDIVVYFLKMALGAPLLGMGFGLVAVWLLGKADRSLTKDDTTIQIAITFCTAYLVFFTAEWECEVSGVLACCGAGCMLAWKAPPLILEPETMHHVWGMIEWAANTVIFMLAGLIIGKESIHSVEAIDWFYLILLYFVLSVIRVIVVAVLYPGIKNTGLKCSFKDAVFVSWGGLRGALAMSLAVIFKNEKEIDVSGLDRHRVLFFVGGIAALTIIINGVSSSWVLDKLGLLTGDDSPDKVLVLKQVQRRLRKKSFEYVVELAKQMHIRDPADVVKFNTLLKNFIKATGGEDGTVSLSMRATSEAEDRGQSSSRTKSSFNVYGFEVKEGDKLISPLSEGAPARALSRASEWLLNMRKGSMEPVMKDLHVYVRTVFLEILRAQYWKYIEDGKLPRESYATHTLLYSIENALDRVHKTPLRDWKYIKNEMIKTKWEQGIITQVNECITGGLAVSVGTSVRDAIASRDEKRAVYILTAFIEAHEAAQEKLVVFLGHAEEEDGEHGTETEGAADHKSNIIMTPEERHVIDESKKLVAEAREMLRGIDDEIISSVQTKQAALVLLARQTHLVEHMMHEGLLSEKDGEVFFEKFREDEVMIRKSRRRDYSIRAEAMRLTRSVVSSPLLNEAGNASALSSSI